MASAQGVVTGHQDMASAVADKLSAMNKREAELESQLQKALEELAIAKQLQEAAELQAASLEQQNATLQNRVKHLATQKRHAMELKEASQLEAQALRFEKMALEATASLHATTARENKATIAKLHAQLEAQAQQHQLQSAALLKKTVALITGLLPSGASSSDPNPANGQAPQDEDLMASNAGHDVQSTDGDVPTFTATLACDNANVQQQVFQLLAKLYSDEVNEEDAAQQLSQLQCSLQLIKAAEELPRPTVQTGASPFAEAASDAASTEAPVTPTAPRALQALPLVDESRSSNSNSPQKVADAYSQQAASATMQATPGKSNSADSDGSDTAQAAAAGLQSSSSLSSLSSAKSAAAPDWSYYTSFVLTQPEKLMRLVHRANKLAMPSVQFDASSNSHASTQPAAASDAAPKAQDQPNGPSSDADAFINVHVKNASNKPELSNGSKHNNLLPPQQQPQQPQHGGWWSSSMLFAPRAAAAGSASGAGPAAITAAAVQQPQQQLPVGSSDTAAAGSNLSSTAGGTVKAAVKKIQVVASKDSALPLHNDNQANSDGSFNKQKPIRSAGSAGMLMHAMSGSSSSSSAVDAAKQQDLSSFMRGVGGNDVHDEPSHSGGSHIQVYETHRGKNWGT